MVPPHVKDIAVNSTTSSASSRRAALVLIAVALALAGCGRKGMLDLPPNTPVQSSAVADPDMAQAKGSLFDPSYGMNSPPAAAKGQKKPFVLDPLLND